MNMPVTAMIIATSSKCEILSCKQQQVIRAVVSTLEPVIMKKIATGIYTIAATYARKQMVPVMALVAIAGLSSGVILAKKGSLKCLTRRIAVNMLKSERKKPNSNTLIL